MATCAKCDDTGTIHDGDNRSPCDCPAGDTALFDVKGVYGLVSGAEMRRHFLPNSPQPIATNGPNVFAAELPGRVRE